MADDRDAIPRWDAYAEIPEGRRALAALERAAAGGPLTPRLRELLKLRASQLNGCAFCIDMHSKDARAGGETEQRLYALSAWAETSFFTERERAALALTEAVTLIADHHVDDVVEQASVHFAPDELTRLLFAIIVINSWNRLGITTGSPEPGSYEVPSGR